MTAWRAEDRPVARIETIGLDDLAQRVEAGDGPQVLDVRNAGEYEDGHIPGSLHIPYGELLGRIDEVPRDRPVATICKAGKRSGLAASILQREGFEDVMHVSRGNAATWAQAMTASA